MNAPTMTASASFRHAGANRHPGFGKNIVFWTPVFTGVTTLYDSINDGSNATGYDILENTLINNIEEILNTPQ